MMRKNKISKVPGFHSSVLGEKRRQPRHLTNAFAKRQDTSRGLCRSKDELLNSFHKGGRQVAPDRCKATAPEARLQGVRQAAGELRKARSRDRSPKLPKTDSMHRARPQSMLDSVRAKSACQTGTGGLTAPDKEAHPSPKAPREKGRPTGRRQSRRDERRTKHAGLSTSEVLGPPSCETTP